MRPTIGLNTSLVDMDEPMKAKAVCHLKYIDAVAAAGGVPVVLPPYTDRSMVFEILDRLDGFCLIGGPDYDPRQYGGHSQPPAEVMHGRRHTFDLWLAEALLNAGRKAILGICGGHQLLNIALGGALVQDLRSEWKPSRKRACTLLHSSDDRKSAETGGTLGVQMDAYRHEVKFDPQSRIAKITGCAKLLTNSFHHQAVQPDKVGSGLRATAWAPDGVIEALEAPGERFVLGVQWHPERMTEEQPQRAIFEALVAAART